MDERRAHLWELHDFSKGHGLEVGPLHRPLVHRSEADVQYLDVRSRDELLEHYAGDDAVLDDDVPHIDFPLIVDGVTRTLVEATAPGAPFDWAVASHVVEHVPDVVGWLAELAEVVVDDGRLVLVVPDRRYCFDVLRPPTTLGQMLAAHAAGDRRPHPAAVFDYFDRSVDNDARDLWAGRFPGYDAVVHGTGEALEAFDRALAGEYVDCHVWLFTPDSFVRQLHDLRTIGRSSWVVETVEETRRDDIEFFVVLRRIPRDADATGHVNGEEVSHLDAPDWIALQQRAWEADDLTARVAELEEQLARTRRKVAKLRRRLRRRRAEVRTLQQRPASGLPAVLPRVRAAADRLRRPR